MQESQTFNTLLLRFGYVESSSLGLLLMQHQLIDFTNVYDALRNIGQTILDSHQTYIDKWAEKLNKEIKPLDEADLANEIRSLLNGQAHEEYDLWEAGWTFWPESDGALVDFSRVVEITQMADEVIAAATFHTPSEVNSPNEDKGWGYGNYQGWWSDSITQKDIELFPPDL